MFLQSLLGFCRIRQLRETTSALIQTVSEHYIKVILADRCHPIGLDFCNQSFFSDVVGAQEFAQLAKSKALKCLGFESGFGGAVLFA